MIIINLQGGVSFDCVCSLIARATLGDVQKPKNFKCQINF